MDTIDKIWDELVNTTINEGIPLAKDLKKALKQTKEYQRRKSNLLDFYYVKIHEAFIENSFGVIVSLSKSNLLLDKETINTVHDELMDFGYTIKTLDADREEYLVRWD